MLSFHQLSIESFDVTLRMAEELAQKQQKKDKKKTAELKRSGSNCSARSEASDNNNNNNNSLSGSSRSVGGGISGGGRKLRSSLKSKGGGGGNTTTTTTGAAAAGSVPTKISTRAKLGRGAPGASSSATPLPSVVSRKSLNNNNNNNKNNNKNADGGKASSSGGAVSSSTATTVLAAPPPAFHHTMTVDRSWQKIKGTVPKYEESLGEQIILRMIELDGTARTKMSLTSLRSTPNNTRFHQLSHILVDLVELIVSLVGPDSDLDEYQEEFKSIQKQCQQEGIQVTLLSASISHAIQQLHLEHDISSSCNNSLSSFSAHSSAEEEDEKNNDIFMAWNNVVDFVIFKVQQEQPQPEN